ncbi:MAG TPA: helix-turn-helix transcriptional regulator [Oculatellaceae cyanobacterium]|jgi:transcriptional regulator with XRE-family HTH domain
MSKLSEAIKAAREKAGFKQIKVAELIGETQSNYNSMENGRRPISKATIRKLANIPGWPLSEEEMLLLKGMESIGIPQQALLAQLTDEQIIEYLCRRFPDEKDMKAFAKLVLKRVTPKT